MKGHFFSYNTLKYLCAEWMVFRGERWLDGTRLRDSGVSQKDFVAKTQDSGDEFIGVSTPNFQFSPLDMAFATKNYPCSLKYYFLLSSMRAGPSPFITLK